MMTVFAVCATIGCTVLFIQVALSLFGLGLDSFGGDIDVGHVGGGHLDVGHAHGADFHSADADLGMDGPDLPDGSVHGAGAGHDHNPLRLGKFITIQTIVAFLAFFGLGGLAMLRSGSTAPAAIGVALLSGFASMYALGYVLLWLKRLDRSGTVRIQRALGNHGRVYLRIPADGAGVGKVTLEIQGRTMEFRAKTKGPELKTGANVVVSRVLDERTIEVVALKEGAEATEPAERLEA